MFAVFLQYDVLYLPIHFLNNFVFCIFVHPQQLLVKMGALIVNHHTYHTLSRGIFLSIILFLELHLHLF